MTRQETDIYRKLKIGCYLVKDAGKYFLWDGRKVCYKRLISQPVFNNLLAAGLVRENEAQPGVWQAN